MNTKVFAIYFKVFICKRNINKERCQHQNKDFVDLLFFKYRCMYNARKDLPFIIHIYSYQQNKKPLKMNHNKHIAIKVTKTQHIFSEYKKQTWLIHPNYRKIFF